MVALCITEGDRFHFGTRFSQLIVMNGHKYMTKGEVSGILDKNQVLKENISHYPNRHLYLTSVTWYQFAEFSEVVAISYFRNSGRRKINKEMKENNWVYKDYKYFDFIPTYRKCKTHIIRTRHERVCPIHYNLRFPDMRRLALPLTDLQIQLGITSQQPGEAL